MKTGYRLSNGSDIYSLLDISRRIYPNTEVFEVTDESDIKIGVLTKNFMIKTCLDLMEPLINEPSCYSSINKIPYGYCELNKEMEIIVIIHSKLRALFCGEISAETYLTDTIRFPPMISSVAKTYRFALDNIEFNLRIRDSAIQNYTATLYNLANAVELNNGSDMKDKEFLRQGEHIISSLKAGDWLFNL